MATITFVGRRCILLADKREINILIAIMVYIGEDYYQSLKSAFHKVTMHSIYEQPHSINTFRFPIMVLYGLPPSPVHGFIR